MRKMRGGLAIAAIAAVGFGCAMAAPVKLVPPSSGVRDRADDPLARCLREADSSFSVNPAPLDASAKVPLGGRDTWRFLWWGSLAGPRPTVDRAGLPSAEAPNTFTVKTEARRELADRYVLCLLALGYRWQP
jgi:hypothetical protein